MDLIANDLSIHGQFQDASSFRESIGVLLDMRKVARRWDQRDIYCNRQMAQREPKPGMPMRKAVAAWLSKDQCRAVMTWFDRGGPFWEDEDRHSEDERIESDGKCVTDSAIGEAGYRNINGVATGLISVAPSRWNASPLLVLFGDESTDRQSVEVQNWWDPASLEAALEAAAPPLASWNQLAVAVRRFDRLQFSGSCFKPLTGFPFDKGAAERLESRFAILNRLAENGTHTKEGHRIIEQYFKGGALFSDSSESEKQKFKSELTFPHPGRPGEEHMFGWHGKVKRRPIPIRFHFSWPIRVGEPVYIVYVGPKLTKR